MSQSKLQSKGNLMKIIIAVIASTFFISGAFSQTLAASPSASDSKRDMKVEMHIKDLHAKLKITPAEETEWAAVAKTMHDNANDLDTAIDKREAIIGSATAIDNLNAYGDILQAHTDAVKKLSAVFAPLYASMSDDQKMIADEVFAHRQHKAMNASDTMKQ
jgi:hypothetical protein